MKARSVSSIFIADIFDLRLNKAQSLEAKIPILTKETDLIEKIKELTDGTDLDTVFEAAGNVETTKLTQHVVKKGGKTVIMGNIHSEVPRDLMRLASREVDLIWIFRY